MHRSKASNLPYKVSLTPAMRAKIAEERAKLPAPSRKPVDFSGLDKTRTTPSDNGGLKRKALLNMLNELRQK